LALALLIATSLASAAQDVCDGRAVPYGAQTIEVGGVPRGFTVRPPAEGDPKTAAPVVFAFHPFGMNAQYMQSRAPIGRQWPSAIVIYPEGMGRDAASRAPSWQGRPGELGNRDLAFFDAMLAWLAERGCIDRTRVFVLGYSNGAGLAYLLACERSSAIAGVAIVSGRLGCQPSVAKPVVMTHGLADDTIGYEQALASAKAWASVNGCAAPPKAGVRGCIAAQACGGAPLTMCTHPGGHEYDTNFTKVAAEFFRSIGRTP
jgi:polyhydroxybutyrate depolymerase